DGQWLKRKGYTELNPKTVFDHHFDGKNLQVYLSTRVIEERANVLDQGTITFKFSAPLKDMIRVQVTHFEGQRDLGPRFTLNDDPQQEPDFEESDPYLVFKTGKLKAKINKADFSIDFSYDNKTITTSSKSSTGYILNAQGEPFIKQQLKLSVGECVYGLGERFTPFVKNGQVVEMWNQDGGTSSEVSYKNIPFYLTDHNYGVFVNHPEKVSYEIASENVQNVQFSVPGEKLDFFIIGGDSMKGVLQNYTKLTGKPPLPPAWSFGLWLSTSFTTDYDEETVTGYIEGMAQRDIPLEVFHFDCYWMKEFQWCDFSWDESMFPDPVGMLKRLKDKGLKICVWINPYIAQKSKLFDYAREKGYLLKLKNGDVWQWDLWQAGMGIVDFTNQEACQWYQGLLKGLLEMGVDCFKTDFGERIPTNVEYCDGSDPMKMHNYYAYLYNETVYELLEKEKGKAEAVVFARSATVGAQKFPVHWGGDCWATYQSMAESLRGGLSLSMSGFGFWSHDIGGFESTATPDLYKRWVAFGMLSSHSRLHGSKSIRVPWVFDEEAVAVLRFFTKLKCSLMPYLYENAYRTSKTGCPMMRSMVMEFTDDPACKYLDTQYMLGDALLVAPIFNDVGDVTYYLPEGRWTNFITGEEVSGGKYAAENHDYFSLPLMVKANSLIPVGKEDGKADYDYADGVTLHLFNLEQGKTAEAKVRNAQGELELAVVVKRVENTLQVRVNISKKPWGILLRNIEAIADQNDCKTEKTAKGIRIMNCHEQKSDFEIVL
ncbi:MAG TPA: alpha-xylosidase, partial [Firmicutes bacterium]|nr:alpha-xylosidase [Bacillota bacterium]